MIPKHYWPLINKPVCVSQVGLNFRLPEFLTREGDKATYPTASD